MFFNMNNGDSEQKQARFHMNFDQKIMSSKISSFHQKNDISGNTCIS